MSQPVKLTVREVSDTEAIIILDSAQGQADNRFTLPWLDNQEWNAIFLYLRAFRQYETTWPRDPETIKLAVKLGLAAEDGAPLSRRVERIGSRLYQSVLGDGECARCFQRTLDSHTGEPPIVELHFPDAGSYLQTYPWEVLHDGDDFLFDSRRASLVRYVDFGKPHNLLEWSGKLNILLVDPRPQMPESYSELPTWDRATLEAVVSNTGGQFQFLELDSIPLSTLSKLPLTLTNSLRKVPVIHIDTHGEYGLLCEDCGSLSLHRAKTCSGCGGAFSLEQKAQGYIAFANREGNPQWVSGKRLGKALLNQGVQLVVLSACSSGLVSGHSVFNSVAGALVKYGIPAVVAMQFSVEAESTAAFMTSFYHELANDVPVAHAVASAKAILLDSEDAWYRPVLYLRTDPKNIEGRIFVLSAPEAAADMYPPPEKRESMDLAELVAELEEWKKVHSGSQALYKTLDTPMSFLRMYRRTHNPDDLIEAGDKWQESCASNLRAVPGEWNLRYARGPVLDELSAQTSNLDEITMLLRCPDIQDLEFGTLYARLLDLRNVIWRVLDFADNNIKMLIDRMKPMIGRMIL